MDDVNWGEALEKSVGKRVRILTIGGLRMGLKGIVGRIASIRGGVIEIETDYGRHHLIPGTEIFSVDIEHSTPLPKKEEVVQ